MPDVDYAMTGAALLLGVGLAAVVTMLSLLKTGRVPNAVTVLAIDARMHRARVGCR